MIRQSPHIAEPHRFTVDDYYRMADAGILTEDDRVELLDGEIVQMVPIGAGHADIVDQLNAYFSRCVGEDAVVRVQNPVRLNERSEPEPDIVLARRKPEGYRRAHPTPEDVLLLIEVADSSDQIDRQVKLPLYAQAGIQEVWIIDLKQQAIDVCELPAGEQYRQHQQHRGDDRVAPRAFPDCQLRVGDLLGK